MQILNKPRQQLTENELLRLVKHNAMYLLDKRSESLDNAMYLLDN